ncbi:hypothetical protein CPB85DRAFT_1430252 [Mucidula mucida]|nr:hypothetical protein CPB85DRAFT_1430252 [Mucidula mucida]
MIHLRSLHRYPQLVLDSCFTFGLHVESLYPVQITVAVGRLEDANEDLYGEIIYGPRFYTRMRLARKSDTQDWEMIHSSLNFDLNPSRSLEEEPGSVLVFNLLRGVLKLGSSYVDIEQVSDDYVEHSSDILLETEDVSATTFTLRYVIGLCDDMFTLFVEMSSSKMVLKDITMAALEEMKARSALITNCVRRKYVLTLLGDMLDERVYLFSAGWETNEDSRKDCIDIHQLSRDCYTAAADAFLEIPRGEQLQFADLTLQIPDSHPRKWLYLLGLACSLAQDRN